MTQVDMLWHDNYFRAVGNPVIHLWDSVLERGDLSVTVEVSSEVDNTCGVGRDQTALLTSPHKYSDFAVIVGDVTTPVHRLILSEHSTVFATMFDTGMQERDSKTVVIKDMDLDVVLKMVQYMYSSSFSSLKTLNRDTVVALYSAANQYDFGPLRHACSAVLKKSLNKKSVLDVLLLTDGTMDWQDGLKDAANAFFRAYMNFIELMLWKFLAHRNGMPFVWLIHETLRGCIVANAKKRKSRADDVEIMVA